jgi:hypothetical protein
MVETNEVLPEILLVDVQPWDRTYGPFRLT